MMKHRGIRGPLARAALLVPLLAGCAHPAIDASRQLLAQGDADGAVARLAEAARQAPDDRQVREMYFSQREAAVGRLLAGADAARAAGRLDEAEARYRRVQALDEFNPRAAAGLAAVAAERRHARTLKEGEAALAAGTLALAERHARTVLAEVPGHGGAQALLAAVTERQAQAESRALAPTAPPPKPISLEFRDASLKTVFEVLSRASGLNFVFDKDVRGDAKVTIFVRNSSVDEIVRLILTTQQLESKSLNENSLLIYPKTAAKAREHQEMAVKSFYLANADVKQAQTMLKNVLKAKDLFIDEKLGMLVIRDTPEVIRLAERLVESLDLADPEVMLDLEVLEVSRNQLYELGLQFPDQIGYGLLAGAAGGGGTLAPGYVDLKNRNNLTGFVTNPGMLLNLKSQGGDSNLLANPRIRVRNREKAKIHIGDKLPVFTTTSTANVGVAASVSYLDVGLKLEVEPVVHRQDEVGIKVGLEVSSVIKEVSGPSSSSAYQIGTRSALTSLRLRDGETQVLAGLISNEERNNAVKLPGLGDIPVLGRLFGSHKDSANKTEIVLLITPRIVRNLVPPRAAEPALPAGTEGTVGAAALRLAPTPPRSLTLAATPGASVRDAAPAEAAESGEAPPPAGTPAPSAAAGAAPKAATAGTGP